ncbi:MAG: acetyl-CoA carboxylase, carboxyltransferase subunit beta [Flavobacteriaceae bacterium]|nr:acetyl-CoA carboxylase, carboxyltransferase subunit beta [Flavobacteriaceae bacterium]MCY4268207.1 acetyl-CoA carboxylase, carboxyltransferase subunit beta [Flavobacteriaceae bacterium]MCY4300078.1 acetyl-CoA carboxylase, carboxyltransferase subunit beta [Flavobacteriaceae bacterium]
MSWFKRRLKGITTRTEEKKIIPDGQWYKTPSGKIVTKEELSKNFYVSKEDGHHMSIGSQMYFQYLYDDGTYEELFSEIKPTDFLNFSDRKSYQDRLKTATKHTGLDDAIKVAVGLSKGEPMVIAAMDFEFIGGSMGSVVGEKFSRAVDYCIAHQLPFLSIAKSGGARMMESATSLMQMAKTSAKLVELAEARIPYISLCTHPTTGGTTASFAMLGDVNIAEPNALIAFAGPRVVKDTVGKELPKGFQTSEFQLEKGFLDFIVVRPQLKNKVNLYLDLIRNRPVRQ